MTETLIEIAIGFWATLCQMAPYLLFGFLVAGILSVFIKPEWVERHLGRKGLWSAVKASLFGVPLPLCSCGVIPVGASLRRHGAGKGATTSFLISTPQTGVDSIFVTWSLLGPVYAIFRPVAAFLSGVLGGLLVTLFGGEDTADTDIETNRPPTCNEACCADQGGSKIRHVLEYGFITLPEDIGPSLLVGLVIAGLIAALVPEGFFVQYLGAGLLAMLVMMVLGIPLYVCATASVPIAAALMWKGATPGAALVFLMTGPATNAATVATIWRTMGGRTVALYLASVAGSALAAGLALDALFALPAVPMPEHVHEAGIPAWKAASAVLLLAILGYALIRRRFAGHGETADESGETTVRFRVEGMTCSHCAAAVKRVLDESEGVAAASVDLPGKTAVVTGQGMDAEQLRMTIESLGYTAEILDDEENQTTEEIR